MIHQYGNVNPDKKSLNLEQILSEKVEIDVGLIKNSIDGSYILRNETEKLIENIYQKIRYSIEIQQSVSPQTGNITIETRLSINSFMFDKVKKPLETEIYYLQQGKEDLIKKNLDLFNQNVRCSDLVREKNYLIKEYFYLFWLFFSLSLCFMCFITYLLRTY